MLTEREPLKGFFENKNKKMHEIMVMCNVHVNGENTQAYRAYRVYAGYQWWSGFPCISKNSIFGCTKITAY